MTNEELIVVKRSGQRVSFNGTKIALAIKGAFDSIEPNFEPKRANDVYENVLKNISKNFEGRKTILVEDIQDLIETALKDLKEEKVLEAFNSYRLHRAASRESTDAKKQHKFARAIEALTDINDSNNLCPSDSLKQIGDVVNSEYAKAYLIDNKFVRAHDDGLIYINQLSSYALGKPIQITVDTSEISKDNHTLSNLELLLSGLATEVSNTIIIKNFDATIGAVHANYLKNILKNNLNLAFELSGLSEFIDKQGIVDHLDNLNTLKFESPVITQIMTTCFKDAENAASKKLENKLAHFKNRLEDITSKTGIKFIFDDQAVSEIVLADVSINLPRIAYEAKDKETFRKDLQSTLNLAKAELRDNFEYIGDRTKESYSYLFSENILPKSQDLEEGKKIRKCIKGGDLYISLIGLERAAEITSEKLPDIINFINKELPDERYNFILLIDAARPMAANYFLKTNQIIFGNRVTEKTYSAGPGGKNKNRKDCT